MNIKMADNNKREYVEQQLREQIKFEQFVGNFFIDLICNHAVHDDGYYKFILELIREIKDNTSDAKELNTSLKNLPGTIYEKVKNGELKDLLDL